MHTEPMVTVGAKEGIFYFFSITQSVCAGLDMGIMDRGSCSQLHTWKNGEY